MKIKLVSTTIFTLIFAVAICAQNKIADKAATASAAQTQNKTINYTGVWNLDVSKSKPDERRRIESMTMTVGHNNNELKIESAVKRVENPEAGQMGGGMGGMRRGGMGGGGNESSVYTLDGKEVVNDLTAAAAGKYTYKGVQEKSGALKLEHSREFDGANGKMKIKTSETWMLSADGKTLTVKRDTETPRGTNSSEMIFTKQ